MSKKILFFIPFFVLLLFPFNSVYADTNFEIVGLTTQTGTPTPTDPISITGRTGEITETIQEQQYNFNIGSIILDSIGEYTDKIYKNNGIWYLQKNTKRITINGTENWQQASTRKTFYILLDDVPVLGIEDYPTMYSNKLEYGGLALWRDQTASTYTKGFLLNNGNLHVRNTSYSNTTDFKTWLSSNNIEFVVPLAAPTEQPIEDSELLNQLNSVGQEQPTPTPTPTPSTSQLIYIPKYDPSNCVEVLDKDTIRVFENEESLSYIDYYINSHYISKTGQVEVSYIKNCSSLNFTTDSLYRNDLAESFFVACCFIAATILPCYMLFRIFYKRSH